MEQPGAFIRIIAVLLIPMALMTNCNQGTGKEKIVVLTFDDAVQSHRDLVAPLLKEKGFGGTFFVTNAWMEDTANFMTWEDVAEVHRLGFEIGNHSWDHGHLTNQEAIEGMDRSLAMVDSALAAHGVPKPVSFGYPANQFVPETVVKVRELGYRFARRGMQPEIPYGEIAHGPLFDPALNNRLVIPTSADAYPEWTVEYFKTIIERAEPGRAIILQFHGIPDIAHPWVHLDPEKFIAMMDYLEGTDCRVIALRDLDKYFEIGDVDDPALNYSHIIKPKY
jgi:peptidoglycan/xylan/chitin deacetylase (PgdA/CDA1 family)